MKTIKKIVFTGGPCSGKTTFTSRAEEIFAERGYRVIIDHESATDLISGGISPATMGMYEFQKYCVALQLKKEEICIRAAEEIQGDKVIIFIDRGLPDDLAYVGEDAFREILKEFNIKVEDMNNRYDMVVHLVTSAKGKEEAYTYANNSARYESIDDARKMDDLALDAWKDHPNRVVIGNESDFEVKMRKAIQAVFEYLGDEKPVEKFLKYLVEVDDNIIDKIKTEQNYSNMHIEQYYLTSPKGIERRIRKRVRNGNELYSYSEAKYLSTNERIKSDKVLSSRQYFDYSSEIDPNLNAINKERYSFIKDDLFFKLDVFDFDKSKGLLSVQVGEGQTVNIPDYIKVIQDVSNNEHFKNYHLAQSQKY